jgi:NADPH-dependent 2,4-dienoyl-CoA reductase/sulfur reductase-like enzyme
LYSEESFDVILIGGSLSAITCAKALRTEGFQGSICVISEEDFYPYNRPPLSKQVLMGKWEVEQSFIHDAEKFRELGIKFHLGQTATELNIVKKRVRAGEHDYSFEKLVIATGVRPRLLPDALGGSEVQVLRTVKDAASIRKKMMEAKSAGVIGAGVLGCEMASAFHAIGLEVVVIEKFSNPQIPHTSGLISDLIREEFRRNNLSLVCDVEVEEIDLNGAQKRIHLSNGDAVEVDLLVAAIGSIPNTEWLQGSSVNIENGVRCDQLGRVNSDIYAIGDVARWYDPVLNRSVRRENQSSAIDQALIVAKHIATGIETKLAESFFWYEILGHKILLLGELELGQGKELRVLAGNFPGEKFIIGTEQNGRFSGILSWNMAREFREFRKSLRG